MPASAFQELGLPKTVAALTEEIRDLYLADECPWIISYSGGKAFTTTFAISRFSTQAINCGP